MSRPSRPDDAAPERGADPDAVASPDAGAGPDAGAPTDSPAASDLGAIHLSGAAAAPVLQALAAAALDADGVPPFSDQSLVEARAGDAQVLGDADAAAILRPGEAELVVHPSLRRAGLGTVLLRAVVDQTEGDLAVWAHGDLPGAKRLAARFGFEATRRLLQQRAPVAQEPRAPRLAPGTTVAPFRPGTDDAAWLDLNARAFASHPEQGSLTQDDLDARIREPWFDAADLLLLRQGDDLVAFCWLKVDRAQPGEFYAVGVAPEHQGEHLGGAAVDAGLVRLRERGVDEASLYVEGDNEAALRLYRARGFTDFAVDVQYTLSR
ncbi:Mycothiol acetyltransferase [Frondihabitans sp. 762G35]|uniref:mycothiol synthase n=1 Tax=Frondihabitans sp. 762G35 TaxID=1446794 RepID=UPI000D221EE3|nr:mycothiol synthase [Frondihabitans sp. 762G35]ARC55884.1 Mycothiol acetyltransferase [Frondihabitans sp. 762G35]